MGWREDFGLVSGVLDGAPRSPQQGVAVILESAQVRSIVDSFLSQQLGGPEE